MSIVFDGLIIIVIACSVYMGYKKGIIDIGFRLLSFIVSILIALMLYSPITNLVINNTEIDEKIEEIIIANTNVNSENSMLELATKPIARNAVGMGIMILLFLFSKIILMLLKTFTDIISKIPVIKQVNEIAGLAYGLIIGLIIIYVILAITFFILSMKENNNISTAIENSFITRFFYNNNIILNILS
ncbi:MAG: CvpA family protein [Clostridia bacterium]|nr:CvpA family protein [Clostridia bacterium]